MKKVDLTIIIVSYNTKELLEQCLRSVFRSLNAQKLSTEVIVVDNHSTDGSGELVKTSFPKARLIKNRRNVGFGKANNQGIASAQGDTVLLLNSDTLVINEAIYKLYRFFLSLSPRSIVGGKLFNLDDTPQPSCGPAYSLVNIFIALFLKGDYIGITRSSPDNVTDVDWVMGACLMTHTSAFLEAGGFDEGIFMYMEEIDWQYRAKKQGYSIKFYPHAHFYHKGAGSSEGRNLPILQVYRGLIYFYRKHRTRTENLILKMLLIVKAVLAIILFSILLRQSDAALYKEALHIAYNRSLCNFQ